MKKSELLLEATKYLRGHVNCTAFYNFDNTPYICNAVERAIINLGYPIVCPLAADTTNYIQQHINAMSTATVSTRGYTLWTALKKLGKTSAYGASDYCYWPIRDAWLADRIAELQARGE